MFAIHTSNKVENLLAHLAQLLASDPLYSLFEKEIFLIQSQGMERWISQQLATQFRVWGNFEFLFPSQFFNSISHRIDSNITSEPFSRSQMLWEFVSLLENLDDDVFIPLIQYLEGENQSLKRFQLAQHLAKVFDQYQIMRPDMLAAWQAGKNVTDHPSEQWQKALWLRLTEKRGDQHRGLLWLEVIGKLRASNEVLLKGRLPKRISVFGLHSMPPIFLNFLQGLAKHIQIHFYLLNPTDDYWADLESKKQVTRRNLRNLEQGSPEQIFNTGHPLLASLGQQGREFQELLLEYGQFDLAFESFEQIETAIPTNLHRLQNDILNNELDRRPIAPDESITVHSCHSRLREVQILKDILLKILEDDGSLELRDIIVMAPDIQSYAPFIPSIFDDVPHSIADRSLRLNNDLLDAFIRFLRLSQSRFGYQEILDLLERPTIYPSLGLSELDLNQIRYWITKTNIRWGQSADHKQELGLPAFDANTWQAGLDRLLMGYIVGDDRDFVNGVLPYPEIEGSTAKALGQLSEFLRRLINAGSDFKQPRTLEQWADCLSNQAHYLFSFSEIEENKRWELNELIAELKTTFSGIHPGMVNLDIIIAWFDGTLVERKSASGFLRGQLTFCSMLPMRSIPFKVIALLGLNDGEFPTIDSTATFDLIGENFRKGDRSSRTDDRYQFLEILLSTREKLVITYIGQSIRENHPIPPSVVVTELLEVLQSPCNHFNFVTEHPLQTYSGNNIEGRSLTSFSDSNSATAQRSPQIQQNSGSWWRGEIPSEEIEVIELASLFEYFGNPQKFFVQRKLQTRLYEMEENLIAEREPFEIGRLDSYMIKQEWVCDRITGGEKFNSAEKLQARGEWLSGTPGKLLYEHVRKELYGFIELIHNKQMGFRIAPQLVDLLVGPFRLVGTLDNVYEQGAMHYRYANLKGKDFVRAWLQHLIANQLSPQNTLLLSKDADLYFEHQRAQITDLQRMITIYLEGQKHPNTFFVEPALAYIKQAQKLKTSGRTKKTAIEAAREVLTSDIQKGYEPETTLLYRGREDYDRLLNTTFEEICRTLLLPTWEEASDGRNESF